MKPQPHIPRIRKGSAILAAFAMAAMIHSLPTARAATQYAAGTFTWDNATTAAWSSVTGGPYTATWTSGNDAVLEGTAGAVSIAAAGATVHNIAVRASGYSIQSNTLTLNGSTPTITNDFPTTISSIIGGSAGLSTIGAPLTLSAANAYTGVTTVSNNESTTGFGPPAVVILNRATSIPGGIATAGGTSHITMNNGVIGLATGDFTRSLAASGTATAVDFSGAGGWAAYGADRVVNLGGASASIAFATANTGFNAKALILGSSTATNMVDFQNPLALGTVACTVQVEDGAAAVDGRLSGILSGGTGGALTKTGSGTLELSAANTYTGATTISAGLLKVTGSTNASSAVTISAGGALGGTGTVSGAVTAAVGSGSGAGGSIKLLDGTVGTLNLGSTLTFSGTAGNPNYLYFDLGTGATTDMIAVAGVHSAATANGALIYLNQLAGGSVTPGTYTLIQGTVGGNTMTGYALATTRSGHNVYSALGASGNNLQVTIAAGNPGGADSFCYWKGNTTVWNTAQWYSDAGLTTTAVTAGYNSNARIASGAGGLTNTLGQDFEINSLTVDSGMAATSIGGNMLTIDATTANGNTAGNGITVNNTAGTTISSKVGLGSSQTWTVGTGATLTVSGAVNDAGRSLSLTKAGAGTLVLSGVNTYIGDTTVNNGTLQIGGAGTLGNGTYNGNIALNNNSTLNWSSTAAQTLQKGTISGTGSLNKNGSGALSIGGINTFSGGLTLASGSMIVMQEANYSLPPCTITLNSGTTMQINRNNFDAARTLNMNGGTYQDNNGYGSTWNGPVNLIAANSTFDETGNGGTVTINGVISGTGGLTYTASAGGLVFNAVNTYSGPTIIKNKSLQLGASGSINNTSQISIIPGASVATTFDVSLKGTTYNWSTSTSLAAAGTTIAANLKGASGGTINMGSQPITLTYNALNPALTISQGTLALTANPITVNTASPLGIGTYTVATQTTGNITVSGTLPGVTGTAIGTGKVGTVSVSPNGSGSNLVLTISTPTLAVTGFPTTQTAGTAGTVTVTAKDGGGNTASAYVGTVHFTSTDGAASLPADYTFLPADNGVHVFNVTLKTAGTQSITATDTVTGATTGMESGITVNPANATSLAVSGFPVSKPAGVGDNVTVTAKDAYGNTVTGYTGTIHFTSTDGAAYLPADYTFLGAENGTVSLAVVFETVSGPLVSITVTDTVTPSITGTESGITVLPGASASSFLVTLSPGSPTAGVAAS